MPGHQYALERMKRDALPAIIVSAIILAGCAVVLISPYDETTDKNVTALAKSVDGLLGQLDQDPVPHYSTVKKTYDDVRADMNALHLRNEARPNNAITVQQLDGLRAQLDTLEQQHREGRIVKEFVGPARQALEQTFRAILKLELAKKELNKKQ